MDPYGLSSSTLNTLQTYMPGAGKYASCLDEHEWFKHGSCAAMVQDNYWGTASSLMNRFGQTAFNNFLKNHIGRSVTRTQMISAFEGTFGAGSRSAASFNCTKINGVSYFTEVWVNLNKSTLNNFPGASALVTDGAVTSTCPSTQIYIALP